MKCTLLTDKCSQCVSCLNTQLSVDLKLIKIMMVMMNVTVHDHLSYLCFFFSGDSLSSVDESCRLFPLLCCSKRVLNNMKGKTRKQGSLC